MDLEHLELLSAGCRRLGCLPLAQGLSGSRALLMNRNYTEVRPKRLRVVSLCCMGTNKKVERAGFVGCFCESIGRKRR